MASVVEFSPSVSGNGSSSPHLTRKERDLLLYLRRNAGKCLPRTVLLQEVWGYREGVRSRTLDVHVQRLRKKLGPAEGGKILTVFRGGYLWAENGASGVRSQAIAPQESAAAD